MEYRNCEDYVLAKLESVEKEYEELKEKYDLLHELYIREIKGDRVIRKDKLRSE